MKIKNMARKRIFVVGVPRSGTTLIQSILNAHDDILGFPESHFYRHLFFKNKLLKFFVSHSLKENLSHYCDEINKIFGTCVRCDKSIFSKRQNHLFIHYLDCIANELGKLHWSEKTPYHVNFIPYIQKQVQNVYFIHVIRDPLDTVASLYEASHSYPEVWGNKSIQECCLRWNKDIQTSLNFAKKKGHYFVQYESINRSNISNIKYIFDFLGLNFSTFNLEDISRKSKTLVYQEESWKEKNKFGLMKKNSSNKFYKIFNKEQQNQIKALIDYKLYEAFFDK